MSVVDASALLAFLGGEPGADVVEEALEEGAHCSTASWSEAAQEVLAAGGDWDLAGALLAAYDLDVAPVVVADAEWAARRWRAGEGLSLGDRLCLALAARLGADAVTADRSWGDGDGIRQIR